MYFADKIHPIWTDLDFGLWLQNLNTLRASSGPVSYSGFVLVSPDGIDRIVRGVRPTTNVPNHCPSWWVRDCREGFQDWICPIVNASFRARNVSTPLKEAVICPLLKKPNLDPSYLANIRLVSNLLFLDKVIRRSWRRE